MQKINIRNNGSVKNFEIDAGNLVEIVQVDGGLITGLFEDNGKRDK